jgi:hypothetical protein
MPIRATIRLPEEVSTMRLPRSRFTVRRSMLIVALASLAMGGGWGFRMWWLSRHCANRAQAYKLLENSCRALEATSPENAQNDEELAAAISALDTSSPELPKHFNQRTGRLRQRAAQSLEHAAGGSKPTALKPRPDATAPWASIHWAGLGIAPRRSWRFCAPGLIRAHPASVSHRMDFPCRWRAQTVPVVRQIREIGRQPRP